MASWLMHHRPDPVPLQTIKERWQEIRGQRVLLRVDLNVPLDPSGKMLCDYRLRRVVGLLWILTRLGCRVVMISHLGRPEGRRDPSRSLRPFVDRFAQLLEPRITFLPDCVGPAVEQAINQSKPGSVFLLENLRFHPGEESADWAFGRALARLGDCFINDAFSVSHRPHASVVVLPKLLPAYAGPSFVDEFLRVQHLAENIQPPLVVLSGGVKLDKLAIYRDLMPRVKSLLLGSGFVASFRRTPEVLGNPDEVLQRVVVPPDVLVETSSGGLEVVPTDRLEPGMHAADMGPASCDLFCEQIRNAGTLVFNGSLGALPYNHPHSSQPRILKEFIASPAIKVVCGGTACSLFLRRGLARHINYLFPGGGATLAFLQNQSNPAISYLAKSDWAAVLRAAPSQHL